MTVFRLRNIVFSVASIAVAVWAFMSCNPKTTHKPTITVSIQPQKYLLKQLVGDKWEVKSLLSNSADPESYDPSFSHLMNLENSDAYFRIGNIPFESAIINKVHNNSPNLRIFDNSRGIALIEGTHSHESTALDHADVDPHTWTSVKNAKMIASNMLDALVELDPDNKDFYAKNFYSLKSVLDSLDAAFDTKLSPLRGTAFAVWHPSLSYFARDYGLKQIAFNPEGKEVPIQQLQEIFEAADKNGVKVFFFQKDTDSRQAQSAAEHFKANTVEINPLNYNWEEEMQSIVNALANQQPTDQSTEHMDGI